MEMGSLEIKITGKNKQGIPISPKTLEMRDAELLLSSAVDLMFPDKKNREDAFIQFQDSSLKTIIASGILIISSFTQNLSALEKYKSLSSFPKSFQTGMETLQNYVIKNGYEIYIKTSLKDSPTIKIDSQTKYFISKSITVDTELYLYGKLINAGGGKDNINIHLQTNEGTIVLDTTEEYLSTFEKNLLFKQYEVHVSAKQNWQNGEIEPRTYKVISMREFNPAYDKKYNDKQTNKASKWMSKYKPNEILSVIRGEK